MRKNPNVVDKSRTAKLLELIPPQHRLPSLVFILAESVILAYFRVGTNEAYRLVSYIGFLAVALAFLGLFFLPAFKSYPSHNPAAPPLVQNFHLTGRTSLNRTIAKQIQRRFSNE